MAHYRWLPRTIIPNLQGYWYDFKRGVRNLRTFWRAVWDFAAWDWTGLVELMEVAMLDMADCQQHGPTVDGEKMARDLRMYALLCRRLREDRYAEEAGYQPHGMSDEELRQVFKRAGAIQKQDEEALATMFRHIRCWWN